MKLSALTPDARNANKGTARGRKLVRESLKRYGAGRSILIDKSGNVIAGNKTPEGAKAVGLEDIQIVKSDGSKLVAVQRTDLDINDKAARELAIADNRASELGLEWDPEILKAFDAEDVDLTPFWDDRELVQFWANPSGEAPEPKLEQASELQKEWCTERGLVSVARADESGILRRRRRRRRRAIVDPSSDHMGKTSFCFWTRRLSLATRTLFLRLGKGQSPGVLWGAQSVDHMEDR